MKIVKAITICIVLCYIVVSVGVSSCTTPSQFKKKIQTAMEESYFEGQRDALEGDVRIKRNQDSCWIWSRSPWENNNAPLYDPSYNCQ